MKLFQSLFLFAETIGFSIRLWWWKRFQQHERVKHNFSKDLFHSNGKPTRYLHTIVFTTPNYATKQMVDETWHYYRQFKQTRWVTIRTKTPLR